MDIKLLTNVLHDAVPVPAGTVCREVPEDAAMRLIASGAAVEVEEIPDVPPVLPVTFPGQNAGDQAPAAPASLSPDLGPDAPAPSLDAAANALAEAAPVVDSETEGKAETGKKAGKAEGK